MEVRIFTKSGKDPDSIKISPLELSAFVDFLKEHGVEAADGSEWAVSSVVYNVMQSAVDIACEPAG